VLVSSVRGRSPSVICVRQSSCCVSRMLLLLLFHVVTKVRRGVIFLSSSSVGLQSLGRGVDVGAVYSSFTQCATLNDDTARHHSNCMTFLTLHCANVSPVHNELRSAESSAIFVNKTGSGTPRVTQNSVEEGEVLYGCQGKKVPGTPFRLTSF
jgi:hypothetical protein